MSEAVENVLMRIPIVKQLVALGKRLRVPGFEGLSLYDLLEIYIFGIMKGAMTSRASAIAFSLFLALFPLIIFLVTLLPYLIPLVSAGDETFDTQFLAFMESFLPEATSDYFSEIFQQIKSQRRGGLLSSAFILSIFLVANGVNAIFSGFNYSYHVELTRNFFRQYAYALGVGLFLSLLLIAAAVGFVYFEFYVVEYLGEYFGKVFGYDVDQGTNYGVQLTKLLLFMLLSYSTTAILYFYGTVGKGKSRFFSPGATMTTILFVLTSYLFGIYVDKFASYNELYGALGGLLILVVYIWLNSNILLLGFEMNATIRSLKRNGKYANGNH
jgi:membrane protein